MVRHALHSMPWCSNYLIRFALFQAVSAYTNTGMSLEDQSMVPFQKAYLMIIIIVFLILAGNTAFVSNRSIAWATRLWHLLSLFCEFLCCVLPFDLDNDASLRLFVWLISKIVPKKTRMQETLHFLLDHPRRCFLYLFPSHQTWFLVTVLVILK